MTSDIRFAVRQLLKSPGFTIVALLSLALGIGFSAAIFSLVNAVLLRSLPVPNPGELRVVKWSGRNAAIPMFMGAMEGFGTSHSIGDAVSYPIYRVLREECRDLAEVFACTPLHNVSVRAQREPFVGEGAMVSDNFFSALGIRPVLGQLATEPAAPDEGARLVVITYDLWERQFDLRPEVLGQAVLLNGQGFLVAGVLPPSFSGVRPGSRPQFYVDLSAQPLLHPGGTLTSSDVWWLPLMTRIKPRGSEAQLLAALNLAFAREAAFIMEDPQVLVESGHAGTAGSRGMYRLSLLLMLGLVGVVLLVACVNLAGLSLARGAAREHEYAVRAAVGAGRWRLTRPALAESLLLALLGAGLGVAPAYWLRSFVSRFLAVSPGGLRYDTTPDLTVVAFVLAVVVATALLSGLPPAVRAGRVDPRWGLQSQGLRSTPRLRLGRTLVVTQVALSLILLVGAGLYGRSLGKLVCIDPGFARENLLLFRLHAEGAGYHGEGRLAFYEQVLGELENTPGATSAALTQFAMLGGAMSGGGFFSLPGHTFEGPLSPQAHRLTVSETFFDTMGIPILRGRGFRESDGSRTHNVVVVNEVFARRYLAGEDPVGQTLRTDEWTGQGISWQIAGVCGNTKYTGIKDEVPPTVYFSFRQHNIGSAFFAVRTALPTHGAVRFARQAVARIDPDLPLADITTQQQQFERNIRLERLFAGLCGALAGLALLLSCVGLYGLMAYNVTRRNGEIGIRMALGATRPDIAGPLLREALLLAGIGVAVGLPLAHILSRLIRSQLYGVEPGDPLVLAAAVTALLLVAVAAAWVPARRAARVDPLMALRCE